MHSLLISCSGIGTGTDYRGKTGNAGNAGNWACAVCPILDRVGPRLHRTAAVFHHPSVPVTKKGDNQIKIL